MNVTIYKQDAINALLTLGFVWDDSLSDVEKEELDYAIHGIIMAYKERIDQLPSAQPERKMGKWIEATAENPYDYICSECGRGSDWQENYCPNCGSQMEGDAE